jgi:hypothetical protein
MKALAEENLSAFSEKSFEASQQTHVFPRFLGMIEFAPIQKALRNTMALSVQRLASGDEHQDDVGLGLIEGESYGTKTFATEIFEEYTIDGR